MKTSGVLALNGRPFGVIPAGNIYISTDLTSPAAIYGGVWERIKGKFLFGATDENGVDGSYPAYINGQANTGGEETHILTIAEMPSHNHSVGTNEHNSYGIHFDVGTQAPKQNNVTTWWADTTGNGGNQPHNNMPPYLVVYIWRKIS